MTQENKELLLKDLCARLPYGIKIKLSWLDMGKWTYIDTTLEADHIEQLLNDEDGDTEIKPYLRPMSSMTEEQKKEWFYTLSSDYHLTYDTVDWCNKNHFDYRGLIDKSLALDATGLNIY